MTEKEVIEIANAALAEEFELEMEQMVPEARFNDDLGLDSLDAVDMVVVLEQEFGFKLRDNQALREIRTLDDLHKYILRKKSELEG
ncbi:acyl carrier protein [Halodesulfovibrio marinisediminis]|uniref:Acyl carrier protein n=1 Tax=Halodesulfovibrio marinisediminis DSM 17456 TaxID=1121457 RepID=A0A1N6EC78_9BACT|nr:phosphopantetheine-binding protein [Halodesulfovibrio marinisediminis]SIN80645.1 acyl carrier protein [Halodesulfovibrio marinisediminis DSM 17456]